MIDIDFLRREIEKLRVDYWDCRYSETHHSGITLWNKELKQIGEGDSSGIGIRILNGNGWGFAASTRTDKKSLREIIKQSYRISMLLKKGNEKINMNNIKSVKTKKQIRGKRDIRKMDLEDKKDFLLEQSYELKGSIKSVYLRYLDRRERKMFISPLSEIYQETDSVFLTGGVSAFESGKSEEKVFRVAKLGGFENLKQIQGKLDNAILNSKKFLRATSIKGGKYDVVLSGELTGLFVHEALGHASEADAVLKGASCLKGLLGKKLAGSSVSILDDPTQDNFKGWGSYYYDDEGIKARKNYIIKKGILNSHLHSIETSKKLGMPLTGNARAENSLHRPIVRMSNTYVEKGCESFEEMVERIKEGYFLKGFKGGETNPADGGFQFGAADAYYIRRGRIVGPVRGGGIGGNTLELLKRIMLIENKYSEDSPGFCGKDGQSVYTGGRNPAVLVKGATIV